MDLRFDEADEDFRREVATWLADALTGEFAGLVDSAGPGRKHEQLAARKAWEHRLGRDGWIGIGWPEADGGRGLSWERQVVFHEEYARAGAPGRVGHIGEQLLGPTLLMFGTPEQKARFLPGILAGTQLWCQGYSEPGAGSDLAAVSTRAELRDGEWHIDGQKVWTSLATDADWCFLLARTEPGSARHRGLSYLLTPMDQPGIDVRPIRQLTGNAEFNEVFFDDARAAEADVVGAPGEGWKVAMGTLGVERGVSTFGQQMAFAREFEDVLATARATGAADDPATAERLLDSWMQLQVLRHTAVMTLGAPVGTTPGTEANVAKLMWAPWHQRLGELAVDVLGAAATVTAGPEADDLTPAQWLHLFTRADTIYGGSSEVQRNVVAQRMLGLPRGPV